MICEKNAAHANAMARKLYEGLQTLPDVQFTQKMESNQLFLTMPRPVIDRLMKSYFYFWNEAENEIRFVTLLIRQKKIFSLCCRQEG